jgi:hypothetical protein
MVLNISTTHRINKLAAIIKSLSNPSYRYALKKYLKSSSKGEKVRWRIYQLLVALLMPMLVASMLLGSALPLATWLLSIITMYLDVLKQYWNVKAARISIIYSVIAFAWRLTRSIMLFMPGPKSLNYT